MTLTVRALSSVIVGCIGALVLSGCGQPVSSTSPSPAPTSSPLPKAVVAATVMVTRSTPAPGKLAYVFAVRLDESGGVGGTITKAYVEFDNGFGALCEYGAPQLGQNRLPASGSLTMDPLPCGYSDGSAGFNAQVQIIFKDDNGHAGQAWVFVPSL